MTLKEKIDVQKAVRVTASLESFDGDVYKWKDSFYQIWRYQLTYRFAYKIDLAESSKSGVYLTMVIKPAYKSNLLDIMDDLGYCKVKTEEENIGVIDASDAFLDQFIDVVIVE